MNAPVHKKIACDAEKDDHIDEKEPEVVVEDVVDAVERGIEQCTCGYSTFKFANLQLSKTSMGVGDSIEVKFDVTNTSSVAGDAVAQIYIHQRYGTASRPVRQLKGFKRVSLQPGETKTLSFPLGKEELKFWNPQTKQWIVEPSEFDVWAGEDSTASLHAALTVTE